MKKNSNHRFILNVYLTPHLTRPVFMVLLFSSFDDVFMMYLCELHCIMYYLLFDIFDCTPVLLICTRFH